MTFKQRNLARKRRHRRVRLQIRGSEQRPRLNVFRSLSQVYAQIIDDEIGRTLVSASSIDREIREQVQGMAKTDQARIVGEALAKRALDKGIKQVVFDRGGYQYIGRVKALAEGARSVGLEF